MSISRNGVFFILNTNPRRHRSQFTFTSSYSERVLEAVLGPVKNGAAQEGGEEDRPKEKICRRDGLQMYLLQPRRLSAVQAQLQHTGGRAELPRLRRPF